MKLYKTLPHTKPDTRDLKDDTTYSKIMHELPNPTCEVCGSHFVYTKPPHPKLTWSTYTDLSEKELRLLEIVKERDIKEMIDGEWVSLNSLLERIL